MSSMFRTAAITGSPDNLYWERIVGRQGGRWAEQKVGAAIPRPAAQRTAAPPPDPAQSLATLTDLHQRGVVTDAEFERLRRELPA